MTPEKSLNKETKVWETPNSLSPDDKVFIVENKKTMKHIYGIGIGHCGYVCVMPAKEWIALSNTSLEDGIELLEKYEFIDSLSINGDYEKGFQQGLRDAIKMLKDFKEIK